MTMPLILPNAAPDNRYMVASLSRPGRSMIIFISGVCALEECRAFLTACDPALCPVQAQPYFQNPVDVSSKGFSILGGVPTVLWHFHQDFDVRAFTHFRDLSLHLDGVVPDSTKSRDADGVLMDSCQQ